MFAKGNNLNFDKIVSSEIDRRIPPSEFTPTFEVNASQSKSKLTLQPYRTFEDEKH